jgi:hypothetical protein
MRFEQTWRWAGALLLIAVTGASASPPTVRQPGSVEIPLTGTDAAGTRHRLHGELTFSGVDEAVRFSVSTRTERARDSLEVQLPAGRYTLTLNAAFVVESLAPCWPGAAGRWGAWLHPVQPPVVRVTAKEGRQRLAASRVRVATSVRNPHHWSKARHAQAARHMQVTLQQRLMCHVSKI